MQEFTCVYTLGAAGKTARAVYHVRTVGDAMASHNVTLPEYRDKVVKWSGPGVSADTVHDSTLTPDSRKIRVANKGQVQEPGGLVWELTTFGGARIGSVWEVEHGYEGRISGKDDTGREREYMCPKMFFRVSVIEQLVKMAERLRLV